MNIKSSIANLLFKKKCIFCRRDIRGGGDVCVCLDCMLNLTKEGGFERTLLDGRRCLYALSYTKPSVAAAIKRFKFNGKIQYADTLGELIFLCVKDEDLFDVITYVPCSILRRISRGYDQSRLLAEHVAKKLDKRATVTLRKIRHNRKQSTLKEEEKAQNVKGAYRAIEKNIIGKRILLIDDIVTTGSTIMECGRTLAEAGARSIVYACAAFAGYRKTGRI
ncbi:MAG: ComF family protein [Clostridiales bacterium]|nr:ComF family protein [Clostridiales bacterium]